MAKVVATENDNIESLLKRFKKQVKNSGVLEECKKREFFVKKSIRLKQKSEQARIRNRKKK